MSKKETYEKMIVSTDSVLLLGFTQGEGHYTVKVKKILYTLELIDGEMLTKKELYLLKHLASIYFHKAPKADKKGTVYISCREIWNSMNGGKTSRKEKGREFWGQIRILLTKLATRRIRLKRNKIPVTKEGVEIDKRYSKLLRDIDTNLIVANFDNINGVIELSVKANEFLNIAQSWYKAIPYVLFNADALADKLGKRSIDSSTQNLALAIISLLIISVEGNYKKISYQKISERAGYFVTYEKMPKQDKQLFRRTTGELFNAIISLAEDNKGLFAEYPYLSKIASKTTEKWQGNKLKGYILTSPKNVP